MTHRLHKKAVTLDVARHNHGDLLTGRYHTHAWASYPPRATGYLRTFVLRRHEDVSGVSGTGIVAWSVEFPDGVVAIRWASEWPTSVVFHDKGLEAVKAVHGHDGRTEIEWASSWPKGSLSRVPDEPWGPDGQCSRCGHDDLPVRGTVNPLCWQCADEIGPPK